MTNEAKAANVKDDSGDGNFNNKKGLTYKKELKFLKFSLKRAIRTL